MSNFLKKATEFLSLSKTQKNKKPLERTEKGSIQETGQPQETGDAQTGQKEEEEKTEMKLKDRGKLFVGGLSYATTAEGLKDYFSRFGSVVDAVVMTFPDTKRSRGYGFVTFADPASAELAHTVESHVVDGKAVDIRLFESNRKEFRKKKRKDSRLFLGGIPLDMKEEDMKNFFSRYGKVTDLIIPHSRKTNKPKGYAFLSFEEKEAANKCLSENFVYLGSKRVIIKKATPKDESTDTRTVSDVADGVECLESDQESAAEYEDDAWSLPDDDGQSSASGERTSLFEQYLGFLNVLENYFQPKIALGDSENKMEKRQEDKEWRPPTKEEWEKLLVSLLRESSGAGGDTSTDDEEEDKNDSEESVSDEDEDDYDDSVDDEEEDDDDDDDNDRDNIWCKKLKEILIAETAEEKIGNLKSSVHKNEVPVCQSSSLPFIVKDKAGFLRCSLCQWTPPDGSSEAFLEHCKTPGHRMKTKERFPLEDIQQGKPTNKSTYLSREIDTRMVSSETQINKVRQGLSEKQNKVETTQNSKEQRKKKLPPLVEHIPQQQLNQQVPQKQNKKKPQQQPGQQTPTQQQQQQQKKTKKQQQQQQPGQQVLEQQQQQKKTKKQQQQQQPGQQVLEQQQKQQQKKTKKQQQPNQQKIQKKNENSENRSESSKIKERIKIPEFELNLKVHALAKGMVCIQPVSPNELSCKMCNKVIPRAPDFGTLMKNVSSHLQSKGHLNKLAATESSLKSALDKNLEEPVRSQKNVSLKNMTTGKKEQAPAQKGMPKGKNPGPENNCEKTDKKIPKVAPAAADATPKINFLCVSCNYFANRTETFNAHIKSKLHLESTNKNNSELGTFVPSSVLCKGCNRFLYGSLYDINKHNTKCLK